MASAELRNPFGFERGSGEDLLSQIVCSAGGRAPILLFAARCGGSVTVEGLRREFVDVSRYSFRPQLRMMRDDGFVESVDEVVWTVRREAVAALVRVIERVALGEPVPVENPDSLVVEGRPWLRSLQPRHAPHWLGFARELRRLL